MLFFFFKAAINYSFRLQNPKVMLAFLRVTTACGYIERQQAKKLADWLDFIEIHVQKLIKLPH